MDTYAVLPYVADRRYLTDDGSWHTAGTLLYHIWVRQMNERIQKLAEQATSIVESPKNAYGWGSSYAYFDKEKFAELIVRECMACSIWVGKNNTNTVEPMHTARAINQRIKNHFGVAEREQ